MSLDDDTESHWHLDKKVPVTLIVVLFLQFLGGVWFMSKLEARIVALETSNADQRQRDDRQDKATTEAAALLRADLAYIRSQLDQLLRDTRGARAP
jgi:Tfp pilus assembly protein PilO